MSALIEETSHKLPRIVLIACGSFSPPTPMHLRLFELTRDYFEMNGTHKVVGGILSPTHDSYGKKELASSTHRFAMLNLALQTSNWIRLSDWEISQPNWSRTKNVLQFHQNFINNYINSPGTEEVNGNLPIWLPSDLRERNDHVQLRLLCGADLLESFALSDLWTDDDVEEIVANYGLVVISRFGTNPEKFIFESNIMTKYQRNITLITNWVPNEVSSSMIRRLLNRGQSVKYLLDDKVLEYIRQNKLFNYKPKYITDGVRPNQQFFFNIAYLNKMKARQAQEAKKRTPTSEDTDDDDYSEQMDVSDSSLKNVMQRVNPSVFCCGETEKVTKTKKLILNHAGPGQAVQVITIERGTQPNNREEQKNLSDAKSKKMKISKEEQV